MTSVALGDFLMARIFFRWVQSNLTYEISILLDRSRSVDTPGKEFCMFCIQTSKNDRKMSVVNPTAFPIYFGLHGCKPQVAEDGFVFAKIGEEELERNCGSTGAYI